jgi:hypothetical protein
MAKRRPINGRNYTLFIDYDRDKLKRYLEDWIEWFEQRVLFILIDPIEEIFKKENKQKFDNENFTIFLGITTLVCCGIEALGGFYKGKATGNNFKKFVRDYMCPEYKRDKRKLETLHNYFRCGLAHGFCIKQGGIHWGGQYFLEDGDLGLQIDITELFKDFKQAFFRYLTDLKTANANTSINNNFKKRFKYVFISGK